MAFGTDHLTMTIVTIRNWFLMLLRIGSLTLAAAVYANVGNSRAGEYENPIERSNATIERCVHEEFQAQRDGTACIGQFAEPCRARNDVQSNEERIECIERELVLWSKLLRSEYRELFALLDDGATRARLKWAQRLWADFHKTNCRLPYRLYRMEEISRPIGTFCSLKLTAYRTLELRTWREGMSSNSDERLNP